MLLIRLHFMNLTLEKQIFQKYFSLVSVYVNILDSTNKKYFCIYSYTFIYILNVCYCK